MNLNSSCHLNSFSIKTAILNTINFFFFLYSLKFFYTGLDCTRTTIVVSEFGYENNGSIIIYTEKSVPACFQFFRLSLLIMTFNSKGAKVVKFAKVVTVNKWEAELTFKWSMTS